MADEDKLTIPQFKIMTQKNDAKSKEAGRPIFDDVEVVEVRSAGDRLMIKVFPAHAFARWVTTPEGDQVPQTYAERWPAQYKRFKEGHVQIAEGTPIDELPFLSAARRSELRALSIHTAEAILALDGANLKTLGMWGRELKAQVKAYMDNAAGSATATALAQEVDQLKQLVASLQADKPMAAGKSK